MGSTESVSTPQRPVSTIRTRKILIGLRGRSQPRLPTIDITFARGWSQTREVQPIFYSKVQHHVTFSRHLSGTEFEALLVLFVFLFDPAYRLRGTNINTESIMWACSRLCTDIDCCVDFFARICARYGVAGRRITGAIKSHCAKNSVTENSPLLVNRGS
jgi:hypothetical protein